MSRISVDVNSARIPVLQVGYQGENEVTDVLFDISSWITEFGEGVPQLRVKRPGNSEEESYVLSLTITDGKAVWTVSETDTANKGNGKVQLSYLVGNIVKKAVIYPYKVGKSIVGADNPVDPFDSWIERSKAWAIGKTLDGDDVPETDETYQNNAKYYAEQADILGSAQVVLATEQATLATAKATLATEKADAAAASEAAVNGVSTQLTTRMSAIETEQAVQDARMDTFTSLPEGSTSGNAELADIRVGADGTTYDTAGNAVRGQISGLKSDLADKENVIDLIESREVDNFIPVNVELLNFSDAGYIYDLNGDKVKDTAPSNFRTPDKIILKSGESIAFAFWGIYFIFDSDGKNGVRTNKYNYDRVTVSNKSNDDRFIGFCIDSNSQNVFNVKITKTTMSYDDRKSSQFSMPNLVIKDEQLSSIVSKKVSTGNNIYDSSKSGTGYYYPYSSGVESTDVNKTCSDKIFIGGNVNFWVNKLYHHICYFDQNDGFISGSLHSTSNPQSFTTPQNTSYMIISGDSPYMSNLMVNIGDSALPYEDYFYKEYLELNQEIEVPQISKLPYRSGFIDFTVPVNQYVVNDNTTTNATIDNEDNIVDVNCALSLPSTYTPSGKPTRLIMMCHGSGKSISEWKETTPYKTLVKTFTDGGYAVFDCNGYSNSTEGNELGHEVWGCPRGLEAWRKAYDYVVKNYNVEENFSIYGFSMGGSTALNLVFSGMPNIKCVALGSPVVNIKLGWNLILSHAYGSNDTTYNDDWKVKGYNPYEQIITINETPYIFKKLPPIKMWYGSTENGSSLVVVNKSLGKEMQTAIRNANGICYYREVDGAGHEICSGGNTHCNEEYLMWFNRYNN